MIKMNYQNKTILILGAGKMGDEYAKVCKQLKISNVTIVGKSQKNVKKIAEKYNYDYLGGGYKKNINKIANKDLVIIAVPITEIIQNTKLFLDNGFKNILIEKPGSLYSDELLKLKHHIKKQNVRIGYNRLFYASIKKLEELSKQDGGITSCHFTFTEWIDKINLKKYSAQILSRWGIANSSHVLSMAFYLIGFPKEMKCYQKNGFLWHKTGSIFVGSGISKRDIPFSYHADWNSSGTWSIEVMTKKRSYRLKPLEYLLKCEKNSHNWEKIPIKIKYPNLKQGLYEEALNMLESKYKSSNLYTIDDALNLNKIAEKIFGY